MCFWRTPETSIDCLCTRTYRHVSERVFGGRPRHPPYCPLSYSQLPPDFGPRKPLCAKNANPAGVHDNGWTAKALYRPPLLLSRTAAGLVCSLAAHLGHSRTGVPNAVRPLGRFWISHTFWVIRTAWRGPDGLL